MEHDLEKYKKFLPSKKFVFIIGICAIIVLIALFASSFFGSHVSYRGDGTGAPLVYDDNATVGDLVNQDSNKNGIPDWEETLWGLDPTADGAANKKAIDEKRAAEGISVGTGTDTTTATDKFSQEVLSTILAMQQSGTLTPDTLAKVVEAAGVGIESKKATFTTYTLADMHIEKAGGVQAKTAYENALKNLIAQYDSVDLGDEFTIIADSFDGGGATVLQKLQPIAEADTAIGKQIIQIPTPAAAAPYALELANASEEMGGTIPQIENLYNDAAMGMLGISEFTKASNASDEATRDLASYFSY